jgi:molybdopterin molybdotransferase
MISVEEALEKVLAHVQPRAPECVPLSDSLGRVLAEDMSSDIDSPPHDKSLVDGYAVIASEIREANVKLDILEEVTAGETPSKAVRQGGATRIMTGAPIPEGADAVVMVEQTEAIDDGARVVIRTDQVRAAQNIMPRAKSMRSGDVVLRAGNRIRAIEIGVLAEIGATNVPAFPLPTVAVLSTGNELVPADATPAAGQIRNSNGPMLAALVRRAGGRAIDLGVGRDEQTELMESVNRGLREDVLVVSGGVSAGVLDLVPEVLSAHGVEKIFHKVHLKPGKPLWFGIKQSESGNKLVFGLPGNPVSSLVCFEIFVRPALAALAGRSGQGLQRRTARLACKHRHRSDRPTYYPARLAEKNDEMTVEPLAWQGSADLCTLADADCLAYFPPGEREYCENDRVDVYVLD